MATIKVGEVSPVVAGPTIILNFDLAEEIDVDAALKGTVEGERGYQLKPNLAPFKGVCMGKSPPVVDDKWDGTRFPNRPGHVTFSPFHEFNPMSAEEKEKLKEKLKDIKIPVEICKSEVFWVRGSPDNAAMGCLGVFYANLVLTAETEQHIIKAREEVGLPARPPADKHFKHENDTDERLAEFRFHKSITSVVPDFVETAVEEISKMNKDDAQAAMVDLAPRIKEWADEFRIVKRQGGNMLVKGEG